MNNFPEQLQVLEAKQLWQNNLHDMCTGCGACVEICSQQALSIKEDKAGFFRAKKDLTKCIKCELCEKRCRVLHPQYTNIERPKCFAVMAKDEIRLVSSSGGMFTIVAEYILEQGGHVCGATYCADFSVKHIVIHDKQELAKLRGSKYIQSRIEHVYSEIKKLLEYDKYVLFTGMPCQVAGLYTYLNQRYDKLYTIDLFCHGITSFKVFEKYHQDVLKGKKLIRLDFKAKEPWGWHAGVNAYFEDGTKYSQTFEKDSYLRAFVHSISKNTACKNCKASRLPRQGDLSIGDFFGIEKFDPHLNDNKGTSAVLINNSHGKILFEKLKNNIHVVREVPLDIAIQGNRCIEHPYNLHKNRNIFFDYFDRLQFHILETACRNNHLYEAIYLNTLKHIPEEEQEFYFLAKVVAENCNNRKIVTWIRSQKFENILKKYFNLSVAFGISMRSEALIKNYIYDFNIIQHKNNEYYLVSLDRAYDDKIYKELSNFGYTEVKDFVFRKFKPIVLDNINLSLHNYYDHYGNSIEGFNSIIKKIIIRGFNNHIIFAKNVHSPDLTIDIGANNYINVGENTKFSRAKIESFDFEASVSFTIGRNCIFSGDSLFRFYNSAYARINDFCTVNSGFELHAHSGKQVIIGRDCMFSHNVELWSGDGHSVFDVQSAKVINRNVTEKFHANDSLVIGEHVWVGKQAFLMHGTNIGNGSIVGARSVVKGVFPNNSTIVGNPGKKIKENVAWSRNGLATNINECGSPEYAVLTNSANAPISGQRVLVIGGTRFMGIHLVKRLIDLGNDVTIATRGKKHDDFGLSVHRLVMDVSQAESVQSALHDQYFDTVFNNLAYCSAYVKNVLSQVQCAKYIQLSSIESYLNLQIDMKEDAFNPYKLTVKICDTSVGYQTGKRQAEAIAYQYFKNIHAVTVRIPYVTPTDRLYYYCYNVVNQIPMNIHDLSRGFTLIQDYEVGKFLPWLANQNFVGSINFASDSFVTIAMILDYIQKKTHKQAIVAHDGIKEPFYEFKENTFSLNLDKLKNLGYKTTNINQWFWKLMDKYIARAMR